MKKIIFILFLIAVINSSAQKKYFEFVFLPSEGSQAKMFTFGWEYKYSLSSSSFRSGGTHFSVGFNLARFFSNKFILGVCADGKFVKGFTNQKFSNEFISDFNENLITEYSSTSDSVHADFVANAIRFKSFNGNYFGSYGIMFSPFPQKYGGILLSAKKGYRTYPIPGTYGNVNIGDGMREIGLFDLAGNYSFELSFKPFAIFDNSYIEFYNMEETDFWKTITVSLYYEQINLKDAVFEEMRFDNMVKPAFISKYGVSKSFGIKFGLTLY